MFYAVVRLGQLPGKDPGARQSIWKKFDQTSFICLCALYFDGFQHSIWFALTNDDSIHIFVMTLPVILTTRFWLIMSLRTHGT